jgi:hypothetical protein
MTPMFVHADQGQDQLEMVLVLVDPEGTLPISFRGLFTGMYFATFIFLIILMISNIFYNYLSPLVGT